MYDVIIIGSGVAGMSSGNTVGRAEVKALLISKDVFIDAQLPATIETKPQTEVIHLNKNVTSFAVETQRGDVYYSKAVIINTGKKLASSHTEQHLGRGAFLSPIFDVTPFKEQEVAIEIQSEEDLAGLLLISRVAKKIHCIHSSKKLVGPPSLINKLSSLVNIQFYSDAHIIDTSSNNTAESLTINQNGSQKVINIHVAVLHGDYKPNNEFETLTARTSHGFIKTSQFMETNIPGLFAAGDVTGTTYGIESIAAGQGAIAGARAIEHVIYH